MEEGCISRPIFFCWFGKNFERPRSSCEALEREKERGLGGGVGIGIGIGIGGRDRIGEAHLANLIACIDVIVVVWASRKSWIGVVMFPIGK